MRRPGWRRFAVVASIAVAFVTSGCGTPIPHASPLATLEAGTWASSDGKYSITLEENPNVVHIVLPMVIAGGEPPDCLASGGLPPAVTHDGTWEQYDDPATLELVFDVGHRAFFGFSQAREGDWAVIEDFPCGPDYDPLYLVHVDS